MQFQGRMYLFFWGTYKQNAGIFINYIALSCELISCPFSQKDNNFYWRISLGRIGSHKHSMWVHMMVPIKMCHLTNCPNTIMWRLMNQGPFSNVTWWEASPVSLSYEWLGLFRSEGRMHVSLIIRQFALLHETWAFSLGNY